MKRPLADKRPIGPIAQNIEDLRGYPVISLLLIPEGGELLDKNEADSISNAVSEKLSNQIGQKVQSVDVWESDKVESAIGIHDKQGVYITIEQKDKFMGKVTGTSNKQINNIKDELVRTKGYGKMKDEWYVVGQGGNYR